jgi:hypothetical protein
MKYEIYTTEILRGHTSYYVTANSKEEALEKFKNGEYDITSIPDGDIYDSEIIDIEIYEN